MTDDLWGRPKEQMYKSRMGFHTVATVVVIIVLSLIWAPLLYPLEEQLQGKSVGYHRDEPTYDAAHGTAIVDDILLTVMTIIAGAIYLRQMRIMLRAEPYLGSDRPLMLIFVLGSVTAALSLTLVFYGQAFPIVLAAIIFSWWIYLALASSKKNRK